MILKQYRNGDEEIQARLERFEASLQRNMGQRKQALGPHIVGLLNSASRLQNKQRDGAFYGWIESVLQPQIPTLTSGDLLSVVRSLGRFGYPISNATLLALSDRVLALAEVLTPMNIAQIVPQLCAMSSNTLSGSLLLEDASFIPMALFSIWVKELIHTFSFMSQATLLTNLQVYHRVLRHHRSRVLAGDHHEHIVCFEALAQQVQKQIKSFTAEELGLVTQLFFSVPFLQEKQQDFFQTIAEAVLACGELPLNTAIALWETLYSCAPDKVQPTWAFLAHVERLSVSYFPFFSAPTLVHIFGSLTRLHDEYQPQPQFLSDLIAATKHRHKQTSAHDFVVILEWVTRAQTKEAIDLLMSFHTHAKHRAESFTANEAFHTLRHYWFLHSQQLISPPAPVLEATAQRIGRMSSTLSLARLADLMDLLSRFPDLTMVDNLLLQLIARQGARKLAAQEPDCLSACLLLEALTRFPHFEAELKVLRAFEMHVMLHHQKLSPTDAFAFLRSSQQLGFKPQAILLDTLQHTILPQLHSENTKRLLKKLIKQCQHL